MGHTPSDDGRDVFAAIVTEPLDGGDFVLRRVCEDDVLAVNAIVDDEMRKRLEPAVG